MTSGRTKKVPQSRSNVPKLIEMLRKVSAKTVTKARSVRVTKPRFTKVAAVFTSKELAKFEVLAKRHNFAEVRCGITTSTRGDYVGRMKIYRSGRLCITCECYEGCTADKLTLREFEDHSSLTNRKSTRKRTPVWVFAKDGEKVPLHKTTLLKYYNGSQYDRPSQEVKPRVRAVHRNEFVKCTICEKERRFLLNTEQDFILYHDAQLCKNWTCADFPMEPLSCEEGEERQSRKMRRGCPVEPLCEGCDFCVCFGCTKCRFKDCNCRTCVDFIANAGASSKMRK